MRRAILDDFWGILVPTLMGKSFYTLRQGHEFRVEEMTDNHVVVVPTTGIRRKIPREALVAAWDYLVTHGSLRLTDIYEGRNASYISALLAQMPRVTLQVKPVTLFYSGGSK